MKSVKQVKNRVRNLPQNPISLSSLQVLKYKLTRQFVCKNIINFQLQSSLILLAFFLRFGNGGSKTARN